MKFVLKFLLAFVLVCVALFFFFGGGVVKYVVNFHSERLTGLKMTLAGAEVNWLSGQLVLNNLAIANPDGFKSDHAATIENVYVKIQPKSLFEDVIVVDYIGITGMHVQFDGDLNTNNVQEIQQILNDRAAASATPASTPTAAPSTVSVSDDAAGSEGKKLAIRQLLIKGTTLTFHLGEMEKGIPTKISDIELTNIGTENAGATAQEVVNKILVPLFSNMQKQIVKIMSNPEGLMNQVKDKLGNMLEGLF